MRNVLLIVLLSAAPCLAGDLDHITIDLKRPAWSYSGFSPGQTKSANICSMNLRGEYPRFTCNQPGMRATFNYDFDLPIEMTRYPTFTLKYRAKNVDTNNTLTCIWIDEGQRNAIFPLIDFDKLTVDGKIHDIQIDLPSAPVDSKGTPFNDGPVNGILVGVMNTQAGEGSIELIDLEFRAASDPAKKPQADQPIAVKIVDEQGDPIKNATITADAERKGAAVSATSDKDGLATLKPIKNELDKHALRVESADHAPMTVMVEQASTDPIEIKMDQSMQVGGFIQDEQGKPIANARVGIYAMRPNMTRDPSIKLSYFANVRTDANGQWLSPPLIQSDQVQLLVQHPDYPSSNEYRPDLAPIDELRSGIATIVLK